MTETILLPLPPKAEILVRPAGWLEQRLPQRVPIPRAGGRPHHTHSSGKDNIENLQLLCAHCNGVKGDRPQEYLVARLRELGIAA